MKFPWSRKYKKRKGSATKWCLGSREVVPGPDCWEGDPYRMKLYGSNGWCTYCGKGIHRNKAAGLAVWHVPPKPGCSP